MNKTIVIERDQNLSALYALNLKLWLNCEVILFSEAKFALEYITQNSKSVSLVVCREKCGLEKSAMAIKSFIRKKALKLPVITMNNETSISAKNCQIATEQVSTLIKCAANFLKVNAKAMAELEHPEFYSIPLKFFSFINKTSTPIYEKRSEQNYVVLFDKSIDSEEFKKLLGASKKELFIKKESRLKFVSQVTKEFLDKYQKDSAA